MPFPRLGRLIPCVACQKPVWRKPSEIAKRTFCSHDCYQSQRVRSDSTYPKIGERHAHRVIGESIAGRVLGPSDIVHHVDENKANFAASNLQIIDRSIHARLHFSSVKQSPEHIRKRVESSRRTKLARSRAA